jgi:hypothetical protein
MLGESPAAGGRLFTGDPERDNDSVREYDDLRGPLVRLADHGLASVRRVLRVVGFAPKGELLPLATDIAGRFGVGVLRSIWSRIGFEALEVSESAAAKPGHWSNWR